MADPKKPDDEQDETPGDPSIGDRARAVAVGTGAAAGAIARKLRDGLRGTKSSPDPNVPATLRRLGKDTAGLIGKVTETTGRGVKKVAGGVVDGVKTAVDQVRDKPADDAKPDDGDKPADD
jgi:hypothetical protein